METKEKEIKVENVSYDELVNVLKTIENGQFVNIEMLTDFRMNKTGNPFFGKVKKYSSCNYLAGNSYQKRVEINIEKSGLNSTFNSEKPKGKTHVTKCVLVDDKTGRTHYFMVERFKEVKAQTCFMDENMNPYKKDEMEPAKKILFEQFVEQRKHYKSKKQPQERKVMVITPKVENIFSVTIGKVKYIQI